MSRKVLSPIRPNAGLQATYRRQLERLIGAMHNSVVHWLLAEYRAETPELAQDASPAAELQRTMTRLGRHWRRKINEAAPQLAKYFAQQAKNRVDSTLEQILKEAGFTVKLKLTATANDVLQATIHENVALIKSVAQSYLINVEGAVMRSVTEGRDLKSLADALGGKVNLQRIGQGRQPGESDKSIIARTRRRAALIARDQNNKATAVIHRVRQEELGIEEAEWMHSTAGKEPRPTHLAHNGKRYNIRTGWRDPATGKYIWPGTEINCRCFSRSVLPITLHGD